MKRTLFFAVVIMTVCATALFADDRMRIAVMDFEGKDMSRADAAKISELIRVEIVNSGQFIVPDGGDTQGAGISADRLYRYFMRCKDR